MSILYVITLSIAATAIAFPIMWLIARSPKLRRPNFQGRVIPTAFGFVLTLAAVPVYAILMRKGEVGHLVPYIIAVVGFGVLGFVDDLFGTRDAGGFRGHIGLLCRGRVSTGLIKAVGGGIVGFLVAYLFFSHPRLAAVTALDGLLIILSTNTLNLLDLRPGRAVSCFWIGILAVMFAWPERNATLFALMPVLVPAVILLLLDRSAKVMIGDAGSNVLGAVLGIGIALRCGVPAKIGVLLFLISVNVYSERFSISKLIESNRVLRSVDRLLGER